MGHSGSQNEPGYHSRSDYARRTRTECQCTQGWNGITASHVWRCPPCPGVAEKLPPGQDGYQSHRDGADIWITHDYAAEDGGGYPLAAPEASGIEVAFSRTQYAPQCGRGVW